MHATRSTVSVTPLKVARREFTRTRLIEAAHNIFFEKGFAAARLEDIAQAAGTQRSTLYTHFRDKDELIDAMVERYTALVMPIFSRFPMPTPSREAIAAWADELAMFVADRRTPSELLVFMGHMVDVPPAVDRFGLTLFNTLAACVPAFARSLEPGQEKAHAWATTCLRELGWALCFQARNGKEPAAKAKLQVACELLWRFVNPEGAAP